MKCTAVHSKHAITQKQSEICGMVVVLVIYVLLIIFPPTERFYNYSMTVLSLKINHYTNARVFHWFISDLIPGIQHSL